MTSGGHKGNRGKGSTSCQIQGHHVPLDVVHGDQRQARGVAQPFGVGKTHQQGSDQSGPCGDRYQIHFLKGCGGNLDGAADNGIDHLEMSSGRHFRDDPPEGGVQVVLILDDRRKHPVAILHDSRGSVVAGCLNSQGQHRQQGSLKISTGYFSRWLFGPFFPVLGLSLYWHDRSRWPTPFSRPGSGVHRS